MVILVVGMITCYSDVTPPFSVSDAAASEAEASHTSERTAVGVQVLLSTA